MSLRLLLVFLLSLTILDVSSAQSTSVSPSKPNPEQPSNTKEPISKDPKKEEVASLGFEGSKAGDKKELGLGIAFRWCPAGKFTMGSPRTELGNNGKHHESEDQVQVTLINGFWMGETEVTQGQWHKLMGTTPWKGKEYVQEGHDYAASYVSDEDVVSYCDKLTKQEQNSGRLPKGWKYSLPTEAQWEYACRAETTTKYSFGESESQLGEYGWFDKNIADAHEEYAHRVGQKKSNAWGLRDMHGNVFEWCGDWYGDKLIGGRDPQGPPSGTFRVVRGGSWTGGASNCRAATRIRNSPGSRISNLGFRLAAVPE